MNKKNKQNKEKRNLILVSGFGSLCLALLCLGIGFYVGFITLNYNYITLGTMSRSIMYLFICSGVFIALGVVAISVGFKLFSISSATNFVFYMKKSILLSSLAFFCVIAIVAILCIVFCFIAIIGSSYTFTTFILSAIAIGLSVMCFIFVFKEYKKFMKKIKNGEVTIQIEYPKRYVPAKETSNKAFAYRDFSGTGIDLDSFQRELVRLDEMRGKGLINDQEYQQLKSHWINKMNNKIF